MTVNKTAAGGSTPVSPTQPRGHYRRYRIRTEGAAGEAYFSAYSNASASLRRNIPPTAPTTFTAAPSIYSEGAVTLSWSGTASGTSSINEYNIYVSTSTDNAAWSIYAELKTVYSPAASGSYSYTPTTMAAYTRYRIRVTDSLGGISGYAVSAVIRKGAPLSAPTIIAPKAGAKTFNPRPRVFVIMGAGASAPGQTLCVKTADGLWRDSVNNPDSFSSSGYLGSAASTVYRFDELPPGNMTFILKAKSEDSALDSGEVTRSFTLAASPFAERIADKSVIKAAHMLTLRSAVNAARDYYGLTAYVWTREIFAGRTLVRDWGQHIKELRKAVAAVIDKINKFEPEGAFGIPPFEWLPLGIGRPRADVMNQLQEIVLSL